MRENLKDMDGRREEFTGIFVRFGSKRGWHGVQQKTILLSNIENRHGKIVAEHIWFAYTQGFAKIDLKERDEISFHVRVKEYCKGYAGYREEIQWEKPIEKDYKLSHPTNIKLVKREHQKELIAIDNADTPRK